MAQVQSSARRPSSSASTRRSASASSPGAYGPGYRVVIDALAVELGVSALPVREAIRRLRGRGLVIYRPNAGAQVAPADPGLFDDELSVLAVLEGYATALAAPLSRSADIARLHETTDLMVAAMERMDPLAFGRHNHEFHAGLRRALPEPGRSSRCCATSSAAWTRSGAPSSRTSRTGAPTSVAEHRELDRARRTRRARRPDRASRAHAQAADRRELPGLAATSTRRRPAATTLTAAGRSTWGLRRQQLPDALLRGVARAVRAARGPARSASRPSCSMTHLAGTGLVSANAASTSGCRS